MGRRKPQAEAKVAMAVPASTTDWRQQALMLATLLCLAAALLPCVVSIWPQIYFDVDPRSESGRGPITALGPAHAVKLYLAAMLAAALAIAAHLWAGGRLRWGSLALAGVGIVVGLLHVHELAAHQMRGMAWIAGISLGLAALHLAEHEQPRRWIAAALIAMLIPLTLRSMWFVWVEHPQTVEHFRQNAEAFLMARGFEPGSPQALLYERRLAAPDVVGAIGLSNVFGSLVMAMTLVAAAWTAGLLSLRRCLPAVLPAAITLAGLVTLQWTRSRGAMIAMMLCLIVLAVAWLSMRVRLPRATLATLALLGVILAVAAVFARGQFDPPAPGLHAQDRTLSLLFRHHYWLAVPDVIGQLPGSRKLIGVGPAGFKEHYLTAKLPINPEEVESPHNVFVDYVSMLGVGGLAWSVLLLGWLWHAGRGAAARLAEPRSLDAEQSVSREVPTAAVAYALVLVLAVFVLQLIVQLPMLDDKALLLLTVGVVGFLIVLSLFNAPGWCDRRWLPAGLFLAAMGLLVHNQIEMAFFNDAAVLPAWLIVGAAAGAAKPKPCETDATRLRGIQPAWIAPVVLVGLALTLAWTTARPMTRHESLLAEAAMLLRNHHLPAAVVRLDQAAQVMPTDLVAARHRVTLRLELAQGLMQLNRRQEAAQALHQAFVALDEAFAAGLEVTTLLRLRAQSQQFAAELLGEPARLETALALQRELVRRNPYGLQDCMHLADLLWRLRRPDEARDAYRRALELHEQSFLDPARQLTPAELQHVQERLHAEGG